MTDPLHAARLNSERRPVRFATGVEQGQAYMLECRDMGDHDDEDAGVYFSYCANDEELREAVRRMPDDSHWDRILGILDLRRPLAEQGLGLTRAEWLAHHSSRSTGGPQSNSEG